MRSPKSPTGTFNIGVIRNKHREGITTDSRDWSMVHAGALVLDQQVVTIDGSTLVEDACQILIDNNISSAPVSAQSQSPVSSSIERKKSYIGMFDYGDLITYVLIVLKRSNVSMGEDDDSSLEIKEIVKRAVAGQSVPVRLASDLSRKNPFYSILSETTLLSVVEEFACGTHRVAVTKPDGDIQGMLSQSMVVDFLFKNVHTFSDLESLMNRTLRELGLGHNSVLSVNADSPVLDALTLMSKFGVSSLAVVGQMGVLLGNISITDVKYVIKSKNSLLWNTCFQFVGFVRSRQGIDDGQDRYPVFDVKLDTTLYQTVAKLIATKAHRLWVTDDRNRASGVVSLTDVLRAIAKNAGLKVSESRRRDSLAKGPWA
ncbi:cell separation during budding [Umbelopsis sp. WA50703]